MGLPEGHRLAEALGREAAQAVVALYGSGHLLIPMGPLADAGRKRARIARMIAEGRPAAAIARALRCHVRTVYRVKARDCGNSASQPELLDFLKW